MNKLTITITALVILAGAFPDEAMQIVTWSSATLGNVTGMVSPGQQMAVVVAAVLLVLVGMNSK